MKWTSFKSVLKMNGVLFLVLGAISQNLMAGGPYHGLLHRKSDPQKETQQSRSPRQQIHWYKDLKLAAADSERLQKPMLLKFTASWCRYCTKMGRIAFSNEMVVRSVNRYFIPITVDADAHPELVKSLRVKKFPSTIVLSPDLKVLKTMVGYQTPAQLQGQIVSFCRASVPRYRAPQYPAPQYRAPQQRTTRVAAKQPSHTAQPFPTTAQPFPEIESGRTVIKPVSRSQTIPPSTASVPVIPAATRIAISYDRHCLVSMLDDKKFHRGTARYTSQYRGQTVCFVNESYKQRFDANPEKYWPVADGKCIVSDHENKTASPTGAAQYGAVFEGRLWFFKTPEHRQQFTNNINRYLPK